ncbi:putative ester cyclase [Nocardia transvalensis]|uniref:Putative ester cyclase n=1 Tax=Nocardia transvalensis TaxID=37333 RepID=A0A7W9UFV6_9NOCA|nr:ester cyclase [Nocardia transvalensis]MBB5911628.1 putative ester cyclase [Nocardia transvalensis]
MTAPDPGALVRRLQECFNTRAFDQADDLFTPDFFSHALGTTGFEAGKNAWRALVTRFPDVRVVAEDVLVDGDRVAIRSSVDGVPDGGDRPMLLEIFRVHDGRLAEMWGIGQGLPFSAETLGPATQ